MRVTTILDQIDLKSMALPEFQRGYVWNREQVRGLMQSLYRAYPVGGLLIWKTRTEAANARGDGELSPGTTVDLLLDGQQRVTSLYGVIRGTPPPFFDGDPKTFTGLYFHLEDEVFEFYAQQRMKDNPLWIDVSELMNIGVGEAIGRLASVPDLQPQFTTYINRLTALEAIKNVDLHIEEVTGQDKTIDIVVDIFNRVNSGGTKLSKGDLALARICAAWPDARVELRKRLEKWRDAGFDFKMDWLLRNINTVLTGEALFSALKDVDTSTFRGGLKEAEDAVDTLLNLVSDRLGLDHDRVLGGRFAFPVMARLLQKNGGRARDHVEQDRLLYWYVHSFLWGRYAGSTETVMNRDLAAIEEDEGVIDRLIENLRQSRGDLTIHPGDFAGWSLGARFYPLLYLLTRKWGAKDWGSGVGLSSHLLGRLSKLQLHHIFPKAYLYEHSYTRPDVNALANFAFLTTDTNLQIGRRPPKEYFAEITERQPGAMESQWVPMDRDLWEVDNYRDFLAARRELLADAANRFLNELLHGDLPERKPEDITHRMEAPVLVDVGAEDEDGQIQECAEWAIHNGLPEPIRDYEVVDVETGEQLAIFDLAWPNGLQERFSQPTALLLDEPTEVEDVARKQGYQFFRTLEEFKEHVRAQILVEVSTA